MFGLLGSAASGRSGDPLALVVRPLDSADVAQNPIPEPLKRQKIGRHGSASDGRIGDSPSDPEDMTHPTSQSPSKQDGVRHCRFVFEYVKDHACWHGGGKARRRSSKGKRNHYNLSDCSPWNGAKRPLLRSRPGCYSPE